MTEVEELYKLRIEDLQRAHKEAMGLQTTMYDQAQEAFGNQVKDLKAQADGLLGALGRLGAELAEARAVQAKEMAVFEHRLRDCQTELLEARLARERQLDEGRKNVTAAREEIARLKSELEKAYEAARAPRS